MSNPPRQFISARSTTKHQLSDDAIKRILNHCNQFRGASPTRSAGQLALNILLYAALIAAVYAAYSGGYWWLGVPLAIVASGLLVRLFIIQHDCGHGSFFNSKKSNHVVGWLISILTFTPYGFWRDAHNRHHANSGNLTRRGMGGVDTLTVAEYSQLSPFKKWLYRFYRNPLTLLLFGPPIYFIILQRLPLAGPMPYTEVYHGMKGSQIWRSVMLLNASLIVFYGLMAIVLGPLLTLAVFGLVVSISGIVGAWLFYIQHQYEEAYWQPQQDWNYAEAALYGSSHYDLPPILQWFTGNIGLHHIHHLCSLIPNYRLKECFHSSPDLQQLPRLTFIDSLKSARMSLWDEAAGQMVGFSSVK